MAVKPVEATNSPPTTHDMPSPKKRRKLSDAKPAKMAVKPVEATSAPPRTHDMTPLEKRRKLSDAKPEPTPDEDAMEDGEDENQITQEEEEDGKSPAVAEANEASPTMVTRRTRSSSASEAFKKPSPQKDDVDDVDDVDESDDGMEAEDDDEIEEDKEIEEAGFKKSSPKSAEDKNPQRKRLRHSLPSSSRTPSSRIESAKRKKEKDTRKERTKKKKTNESRTPRGSPSSSSGKSSSQQDLGGAASSSHQPSINYGANAIPAFYFYLGENRSKIERSLSRRHRYFNRLPKGYERNELVAKEGASWWVKLRQSEVQRFMDMSMKDFEQRIIEWKEEKSIRDMVEENGLEDMSESETAELTPEDERLTYERHRRLYLGTTVGSKPFKPEANVSHNRILLELLQDMRFHPAPMLMANRTEKEYGQMDFTRITIPYFDAHGPVSTSMGDECLGCTRGWTHYCNVLKRRVPAVEHRAKLQPPLSSLMATRVGLGLQPKAPKEAPANQDDPERVKNLEMYSTREDPDTVKAKSLPVFHWEGLSDPSDRADDIVQFIEETVAMKVPEPPRPSNPSKIVDSSKKSGLGRAALPMRGRVKGYDYGPPSSDEDDEIVNKCGRCRTVIQTDTGCIQCRRAQLVINMSRQGGGESIGSNGDENSDDDDNMSNFLKVSTYMLGRVTMKEGSGETQSEGDQAVANGILRQRWTPFAVLPSHTLDSPTPKPIRARSKDEDHDREIDSDASSDKSKTDESKKEFEDEQMTNATDENSEDSSEEQTSPGKRERSARIGAQATATEPQDDIIDRQKMAEKYKEEASELSKKSLRKACCGILLGLMRRDPLLLFARPVRVGGYSAIIKNPIHFEKIRGHVLAGKYATLGSFVSDARLLCTNALTYNPPGSIYWKTAKELYDVLAIMQKRASDWISAIKDCHAHAWRSGSTAQAGVDEEEIFVDDAFEDLRKQWPEAVEILEDSDWLRQYLSADFMRTEENETAYYGGLAVRRAAVAAEAALTPYPDLAGAYNTVGRRTHAEDDSLRRVINERVAEIVEPMQLKDLPTWREEAILRVMRRSQSRRLDGLIGSVNGCARCDGMRVDQDLKMAMAAETLRWGRSRKKKEVARVAASRIDLSTGLGSENVRESVKEQRKKMSEAKDMVQKSVCAQKAAVTVRGSRIHGWGLYADQPFKAGDIVAEYIGEYVSSAVTEARANMYQARRIQDYQFRLNEQLVIDATIRGGHGRYINHNCNPNSFAKMVQGDASNEHLKRVVIVAQRDIKPLEELTYDYQFPLELNLDARIPCNCHSEHCRGFMNWDLPERGSNSRIIRSQKRGANMRDRIRRLGRPLKGDK
jgi:histone-lysine N-methyltransferase SETD1